MSEEHRIISADEDDTKAEKAINALGGEVSRGSAAPGGPIIMVNFANMKVTDAELKELVGLKSLELLGLNFTNVTDMGLKELAGLKSLQNLNLASTQVTGTGFKELAGLKNLRNLYLNNAQVTDIGLKGLAGLKSLRILNLTGTQVTAAGVAELRKALPKCEIIR